VPSAEPLLDVTDLHFAYGVRPALRGATFSLRGGEIFGLLGPNGAGKTTAISCVSGRRRPASGEMKFRGRPFHPVDDAADRARIGLAPQEIALYEDLSARENLGFFAEMSGLDGSVRDAAVDRGIALAGLEDRARDRVKSFSGGMKRRLNLAAGDLHEPELLILDEPTAGVDPQSRNHLFEALARLRAEGRTLLYTTHYMEEAERLCDRIAIVDEGRVLAIGTAAELASGAGIPGANLEQVFLQLTGKRLRDDS